MLFDVSGNKSVSEFLIQDSNRHPVPFTHHYCIMAIRSIYCIFNEIILHARASLIRTRNRINLCARFRTNAKIFNPDLPSLAITPPFLSYLTLFTGWTTELLSVADGTDFEVLIGSFRTSGADPVSRSHLRRPSFVENR